MLLMIRFKVRWRSMKWVLHKAKLTHCCLVFWNSTLPTLRKLQWPSFYSREITCWHIFDIFSQTTGSKELAIKLTKVLTSQMCTESKRNSKDEKKNHLHLLPCPLSIPSPCSKHSLFPLLSVFKPPVSCSPDFTPCCFLPFLTCYAHLSNLGSMFKCQMWVRFDTTRPMSTKYL